MNKQTFRSSFRLESTEHAKNNEGVEVHFSGRRKLVYTRDKKSVTLRIDHEFISGIMFTTIVYLNHARVWSTGEEVTSRDLTVMKDDLRDALAAFESLVIFKITDNVKQLEKESLTYDQYINRKGVQS